jgi:hypothetical protein
VSDDSERESRDTLIPLPEESTREVPLAQLDGTSIYRRRIRLRASEGRASGELEDDFHHFSALIEHDGDRVTRAGGEAIRVPWTTCPGAVGALAALEGVRLTPNLHRLAREVELRAQCTHLFDAATLAIALAASGRKQCVYDVEVPEPVDGAMRVRLHRDGEPLLEWQLESFRVKSPGPIEGQMLVGPGFSHAVRALDDPAVEEPILVLRRAVMISMARGFDMDRVEDPQAFGRAVGARCHTFSAAHGEHARRIVGANRDFRAGPQELLRGK